MAIQPSTLEFPCGAPPAVGDLKEVASGVYWARMPLPFRLDHINVWVLEDGDGWTLVDTGLGRSEAGMSAWRNILEPARSRLRPVRRVMATHFHPDHLGLAGWLCDMFAAELWITRTEWLTAQYHLSARSAREQEAQRNHYRKNGLDEDVIAALDARTGGYPDSMSPLPPFYRRLEAGSEVAIGGRTWRVLIGEGHAPELACLYCPELGVLISGDQILPQITPNVGVWPDQPTADPLGLFLDSLKRFTALPKDTLVLPSHGLPFRGLHTRIDELISHHTDRLATLEAACITGQTAAGTIPILFPRQLDPKQLSLALGEALAHLHHLAALGRLACEPGRGGIRVFQTQISATAPASGRDFRHPLQPGSGKGPSFHVRG